MLECCRRRPPSDAANSAVGGRQLRVNNCLRGHAGYHSVPCVPRLCLVQGSLLALATLGVKHSPIQDGATQRIGKTSWPLAGLMGCRKKGIPRLQWSEDLHKRYELGDGFNTVGQGVPRSTPTIASYAMNTSQWNRAVKAQGITRNEVTQRDYITYHEECTSNRTATCLS